MFEDIKKDATTRMAKCIANLKEHYKHMRTGRANVGLLDCIRVDYYGTETPLAQVANVTVELYRCVNDQPSGPTPSGRSTDDAQRLN